GYHCISLHNSSSNSVCILFWALLAGLVMKPALVLCSKFCLRLYNVKLRIVYSAGPSFSTEREAHNVLLRCLVSTGAPLAISFADYLVISCTFLSSIVLICHESFHTH